MTDMISRWTPPSGTLDHTGDSIAQDAVFFASPPVEIGPVYTAHSVLRHNKQGPGLGAIVLIVVLALVGLGGGFVLGAAFSQGNMAAAALVALAGGGGLGYLGTRMEAGKKVCTYTGEKGIARFVYSDDSVKREKPDLFLFANAVELRTGQTRQYYNGVYTGTSYNFTWTGRDGRVVYRLSGTYQSQQGTPQHNDIFYYARAAEIAWSRYLLQFVNAELQRSGAFRFNLRGNNCVVAGPGYLDLYMNGQQIRCPVDEIAKIDMNQGVITVRRKDAKDGFLGIGASGIFRFTYSDLANGRVFLMLLEQLVGVS